MIEHTQINAPVAHVHQLHIELRPQPTQAQRLQPIVEKADCPSGQVPVVGQINGIALELVGGGGASMADKSS